MPANAWIIITTICFFTLSGCTSPESPPEPPKQKSTPVDSLVDPAIQPRVISSWPGINSEGPYAGFYPADQSQLQIRFNKKMNVSSVYRALNITAPGGNIRVDTSLCSSYGGTNFTIPPVDSAGHLLKRWVVARTYTLTVSSSACDVNGNHLEHAFSMTFRPEPYFRVTAATESLQTGYPFIMNFNSLVDSSVLASIHISPPVSGNWTVSPDSMAVIAYPLYLLMNDSVYAVTVTTDAHDKFGNYIPTTFSSTLRSVTTSEFRIMTAMPNKTASTLYQPIYIGCSRFIDTATIRPAFHSSPKVTGNFFIPGDVYFYFNVTKNYIPETTYTITIDSTLQEDNGSTLSAPFIFTFKTPDFHISSTYPGDGQTDVPPSVWIDVMLNGFIDTASVPVAFSLVDRNNIVVAGTFGYYGHGFYFEPSAALMKSMDYSVTITTGIHTPEGIHLKAAHTFSFKTGT